MKKWAFNPKIENASLTTKNIHGVKCPFFHMKSIFLFLGDTNGQLRHVWKQKKISVIIEKKGI